ncbi:MAG: DUF6807 family protein [Planctomycetota bacterium]
MLVVDGEDFARLDLGGRDPVTLTELRAPGGGHVLRGFPLRPREGESRDHPEQAGMWAAHGDFDGHDLWKGGGAFAREHSLRLTRDGAAEVSARIDWRSPEGTRVCGETRTYRFQATPEQRVVDVTLRMEATGSGFALGDVRDGFFALRLSDGFQIRPGSEAGSFSSKGARGDRIYGDRARWVACVGALPGAGGMQERATVCVLDHPSNAQHPPAWNARPYGLVAANPFAVTAFADDGAPPRPLVVDGYGSLTLRYRVVIAAGAIDFNAAEGLWTEFAREE